MNSAMLITTIVGVLVAIIKDDIKALVRDWRIYSNRKLDTDDDPDSIERGELLSGATGEFGTIIVHKYRFWSLDRGVRFSHVFKDPETGQMVKVLRDVSFAKWDSLPVGKPREPLKNAELEILGLCRNVIHNDKE